MYISLSEEFLIYKTISGPPQNAIEALKMKIKNNIFLIINSFLI